MAVYKRGQKGKHWIYDFRVRGVRYRGAIPEARTKWEAEQAEQKIKQEVFEGRFGLVQPGKIKLDKFIDEVYMPWAKANKRSWKGDAIYTEVLKDYFKGKALCEISPFLIEKFKHERIKTPTKNGTPRAHASVNREFETLSRLFNLAIDFKKAESNPCSRVKKFKLDNERYRYLLPEEEPVLMSVLTGKREHLKGMITVALGLGLRKREQLNLRRDQVDFSRNVVVATKTKGRKNREIPMDVLNPEVRDILLKMCSGKSVDDYVFGNPDTGKPFTDIKAFLPYCMSNGEDRGPLVARPQGYVLYASSASWIRGSNNNDSDGPQGSENDDAIHSCRSASEKCAFSEFWSQISHTSRTAARLTAVTY